MVLGLLWWLVVVRAWLPVVLPLYSFEVIADDLLFVAHPPKLYPKKSLIKHLELLEFSSVPTWVSPNL
jgi:hypothetical protein